MTSIVLCPHCPPPHLETLQLGLLEDIFHLYPSVGWSALMEAGTMRLEIWPKFENDSRTIAPISSCIISFSFLTSNFQMNYKILIIKNIKYKTIWLHIKDKSLVFNVKLQCKFLLVRGLWLGFDKNMQHWAASAKIETIVWRVLVGLCSWCQVQGTVGETRTRH